MGILNIPLGIAVTKNPLTLSPYAQVNSDKSYPHGSQKYVLTENGLFILTENLQYLLTE